MEEVVIDNNKGDDPAEIFNEIMKYLNKEITSNLPLTNLGNFDEQIAKLNSDNVKSYLAQNIHKFEELKIALGQFSEKVSNLKDIKQDTAINGLIGVTMDSIAHYEQELKQHPGFIMASAYQQLHELSQAEQKVFYWEARQDKRPLKAPERIEHYNAEVTRLDRPFEGNLPREMKRELGNDKQIMHRLSTFQSQITDIEKKIVTWTKRQKIMPNKAAAKLAEHNEFLMLNKNELKLTLRLMSPQGLQQNIIILDKQIQQAQAKLGQWSESRRPIKARQKIAFYESQLGQLSEKKDAFVNALPPQDNLRGSVEVAVAVPIAIDERTSNLEALKVLHDNPSEYSESASSSPSPSPQSSQSEQKGSARTIIMPKITSEQQKAKNDFLSRGPAPTPPIQEKPKVTVAEVKVVFENAVRAVLESSVRPIAMDGKKVLEGEEKRATVAELDGKLKSNGEELDKVGKAYQQKKSEVNQQKKSQGSASLDSIEKEIGRLNVQRSGFYGQLQVAKSDLKEFMRQNPPNQYEGIRNVNLEPFKQSMSQVREMIGRVEKAEVGPLIESLKEIGGKTSNDTKYDRRDGDVSFQISTIALDALQPPKQNFPPSIQGYKRIAEDIHESALNATQPEEKTLNQSDTDQVQDQDQSQTMKK